MRVLVAGASGAIGRPLVAALPAHGHAVVGLTRDPKNADLLARLGAQPLFGDVLDRDISGTGGIRTPGPCGPPAFKAGAFVRSATVPLVEAIDRCGAGLVSNTVVDGPGRADRADLANLGAQRRRPRRRPRRPGSLVGYGDIRARRWLRRAVWSRSLRQSRPRRRVRATGHRRRLRPPRGAQCRRGSSTLDRARTDC